MASPGYRDSACVAGPEGLMNNEVDIFRMGYPPDFCETSQRQRFKAKV
jgi:hypothetical protein